MNPDTLIRDVMTTDLVTIQIDKKLKDIKPLFKDNNFHHLLVMDKKGDLVGIISKIDFYEYAYTLSLQTTGKTWSHHKYETVTAEDIMTKNLRFLAPDDTIRHAADLFLVNKFHAIPVMDMNQLVGILTTHDLLKYSFEVIWEIDEIDNYDEAGL